MRAAVGCGWLLGASALAFGCAGAWASLVVVPDGFTTIQAAVDHGVDTVLVRPGVYDEEIVLGASIVLGSTSSNPDSALPSVAALWLASSQARPRLSGFGASIHVQRFEVRGLVTLASNGLGAIGFSRCALRDGIGIAPLDTSMIALLRVEHCIVSGNLNTSRGGLAVVDSCTIQGKVFAGRSRTTLIVRDSDFAVADDDVGIYAEAARACTLVNNRFRGGFAGIVVTADAVFARGNHVEDVVALGMRCTGGAVVTDNHVHGSGGFGIVAQDARLVARNHVSSCRNGIVTTPGQTLEVVDNVVIHCDAGIEVRIDGRDTWVRNNTCVGSGIFGITQVPANVFEMTNNLVTGSARYGAEWIDGGPTLSRCNDWYGNALGAVSGAPPSPDDISIAPAFCDTAAGDFHLAKDSPLLDWPSCGRIGALGQGCALTSTLVERFTASRVHGGVEIRWRAALDPAAVVVQRASAGGPWTSIATERRIEGLEIVDLDREASAGDSYRYRLTSGGASPISEAILVAGAAETVILSATPNPARSDVAVRFVLERAGEVAVGVWDLQGRQVAELAAGPWEAGVHTVRWSGSAERQGVFFVRYRHVGGTHVVRVVRAR